MLTLHHIAIASWLNPTIAPTGFHTLRISLHFSVPFAYREVCKMIGLIVSHALFCVKQYSQSNTDRNRTEHPKEGEKVNA